MKRLFKNYKPINESGKITVIHYLVLLVIFFYRNSTLSHKKLVQKVLSQLIIWL